MAWSSSSLRKKSLTVLWKADHQIIHIVGLVSGVCAEWLCIHKVSPFGQWESGTNSSCCEL